MAKVAILIYEHSTLAEEYNKYQYWEFAICDQHMLPLLP